MIWGRCYIQRFRMVSEFSKNYLNSSGRGSTFVDCNINIKQISVGPTLLHKKMASTSSDVKNEQDKKQNKLAFEKSPYLLQHATNPVDWYPWGEEAIEKARREDKLIFLSVGYSTCHWCHVMEKESFENPDVAKIMNRYFINIKVDREERPDIDKVYMTFIQSISGHGGWPMSVFLTPSLIPVSGGTYFPPHDKYGQPGFTRILEGIALKWIENKQEFLKSGSKILGLLKQAVESKIEDKDDNLELDCAYICVKQLIDRFEPRFGGFSRAPKFPQPVNFNLLFLMHARDPAGDMGKQCLNMCIHTLTKMANGGIHDHVGQGFARYSVDGKWHVPHFEKMLYDQGQLLRSYAEAYLASNDPFFAEVAKDIVTYVVRDLRHPRGGFYSAEDADSFPTHESTLKKEGAFYVWSYDEIQNLLNKKILENENIKLSDIFCYHFNVKPAGNVEPKQDPHEELTGKNVLIISGSNHETAEHFNLSIDIVKSYLQESLDKLFEERKKRPRPHLDYKIITAWNGLMISGLSHVASALNDPKCMDYAEDVAKFIEQYLYDKENKILLRSCYRGEGDQILQTSVPIKGFQVDYAFVIQGLLDLYEITFNAHWLEFAEELQDIQDNLFWDDKDGGYFSTIEDNSSLILRLKDDQDGAEPSGNSVACSNLVKLAAYLDRTELSDKVSKLLKSVQDTLVQLPIACPELVTALVNHIDSTTQIYIVGEKENEDTKKLLRVVREKLIPGKIIILVDKNNSENVLHRKNEITCNMKQQHGAATAYVCHHRACSLPVTNAEELTLLLDRRHISS